MVIEFRCPNGHRLNCPDERAGLPGKCPKCKAAFRVPQPQAAEASGADRPASPISDSGVSEPELNLPSSETDNLAFLGGGDSEYGGHADSGSSSGSSTGFSKIANPAELASETESASAEPSGAESSGTGSSGAVSPAAAPSAAATSSAGPAAASEERIVFLCPKGHKLNCPASMQGRPGKCPHCGATFLVPRYEPGGEFDEEEDEDEENKDDEEESGESSADDESPREPSAEEQLIEQAIEGFNGDAFQGDPFAFDFSSLTTETVGTGGMAGVFQRLWLHKRTGGIVELYLKGGEVIAPEWFSPRQSQDTFGMFAFAERDGSLTMTAVSWDAIERIAVRGIAELPPGMFDEEA
jgi:hypothetical protein